MDVNGRVALVTGASSGIGRAAALRLARAGGRVGLLATSEDKLHELAREIRSGSGEALAVAADVTDQAALQRAVETVVCKFGQLDIVFANAGINGTWAPLDELTLDEWNETIQTNLTGTFLTLRCAAPHLKKRGGSVIVNSSVNGTRMFCNSGATAYASSKAGQVALTKMLALELAKHRIRVNAICPGAIETPIHEKTEQRDIDEAKEPVEYPAGEVPLTDGAPGTPEQVAELVLFLASDASSHITGSVIFIDGGQSLLQG